MAKNLLVIIVIATVIFLVAYANMTETQKQVIPEPIKDFVDTTIKTFGGGGGSGAPSQEVKATTMPPSKININSNSRLDYASHDVYSSLWKSYFDKIDAGVPFLINLYMNQAIPETTAISESLVKEYYSDYTDKPTFITNYDAKIHRDRFLKYYKTLYPNTPVGVHMSGADCSTDPSLESMLIVDCNNFSSDELFTSGFGGNRKRVDIRIAATRNKFKNLIIENAKNLKLEHIYLDNFVHPSSSPSYLLSWSDTTNFISEINNNLNLEGINTFTNVAVTPYELYKNDYQDAIKLMLASDGFSFELPFHRHIRQNPDNLAKEIAVTRLWLDNKKVVMYVPVWNTGEQRTRDFYLAAGLAMILRNDGDSIFVSRPYFITDYSWINYPSQYGSPLNYLPAAVTTDANDYLKYKGLISQNNEGITLTRDFQNGRIQVMFVYSSSGIANISIPSQKYQVKKSPISGSVEKGSDGKMHYSSNGYTGGEVFILGDDKNILIVNVQT